MTKQFFGTDGIRGRVGEEPITPQTVMKLGWAVGTALAQQGASSAIIGKDTRLSGYLFEACLEAGFSAAGVKTGMIGVIPTPAVAYLTRTLRADVGVVISASHNPYYDNGIKLFSHDGYKLPDAVELKVESLIQSEMTLSRGDGIGRAYRVEGAHSRYIEFCKSSVPWGLSLEGMNILLDTANGATYKVAPSVFRELGASVDVIGNEPNGLNINEKVGSTHPESMISAVKMGNYDLGIAFDGDGDRLMMVTRNGRLIDGDEILYLIAQDRRANGRAVNGVVGTVMTNLGVEKALARRDIKLHRAKVGDRYVVEMLKEQQLNLGGENSGHIICLDKTTTGDGIISALQVVNLMQQSGRSADELLSDVEKYPQHMINVGLPHKVDILSLSEIQTAIIDAEQAFGDKGRVLLRPSGTEPVVRVMTEGEDAQQVKAIADSLATSVKNIIEQLT